MCSLVPASILISFSLVIGFAIYYYSSCFFVVVLVLVSIWGSMIMVLRVTLSSELGICFLWSAMMVPRSSEHKVHNQHRCITLISLSWGSLPMISSTWAWAGNEALALQCHWPQGTFPWCLGPSGFHLWGHLYKGLNLGWLRMCYLPLYWPFYSFFLGRGAEVVAIPKMTWTVPCSVLTSDHY